MHLTTKDAEWLERLKATLDNNMVTPHHKTEDYHRLGALVEALKKKGEVGPPRISMALPAQVVELDSEFDGYAYSGSMEINGTWHHVRCLRMKDEGHLIEPDESAPHEVRQWFNDAQQMWDGAYQTITLPGVVGRYVLLIFPHAV
jgi:hypothetical protein